MKKYLILALVLGGCGGPKPSPAPPPPPAPVPVTLALPFGKSSSAQVTIQPGSPGTVREYKIAISGVLN